MEDTGGQKQDGQAPVPEEVCEEEASTTTSKVDTLAGGGQGPSTQGWGRYSRYTKLNDRKPLTTWRTYRGTRKLPNLESMPAESRFGDQVANKVLLLARWRARARQAADARCYTMVGRRQWLARLKETTARSSCVLGAAIEHAGIDPHVDMMLQESHAEEDQRIAKATEEQAKELTPMHVIQERVERAMQEVRNWHPNEVQSDPRYDIKNDDESEPKREGEEEEGEDDLSERGQVDPWVPPPGPGSEGLASEPPQGRRRKGRRVRTSQDVETAPGADLDMGEELQPWQGEEAGEGPAEEEEVNGEGGGLTPEPWRVDTPQGFFDTAPDAGVADQGGRAAVPVSAVRQPERPPRDVDLTLGPLSPQPAGRTPDPRVTDTSPAPRRDVPGRPPLPSPPPAPAAPTPRESIWPERGAIRGVLAAAGVRAEGLASPPMAISEAPRPPETQVCVAKSRDSSSGFASCSGSGSASGNESSISGESGASVVAGGNGGGSGDDNVGAKVSSSTGGVAPGPKAEGSGVTADALAALPHKCAPAQQVTGPHQPPASLHDVAPNLVGVDACRVAAAPAPGPAPVRVLPQIIPTTATSTGKHTRRAPAASSVVMKKQARSKPLGDGGAGRTNPGPSRSAAPAPPQTSKRPTSGGGLRAALATLSSSSLSATSSLSSPAPSPMPLPPLPTPASHPHPTAPSPTGTAPPAAVSPAPDGRRPDAAPSAPPQPHHRPHHPRHHPQNLPHPARSGVALRSLASRSTGPERPSPAQWAGLAAGEAAGPNASLATVDLSAFWGPGPKAPFGGGPRACAGSGGGAAAATSAASGIRYIPGAGGIGGGGAAVNVKSAVKALGAPGAILEERWSAPVPAPAFAAAPPAMSEPLRSLSPVERAPGTVEGPGGVSGDGGRGSGGSTFRTSGQRGTQRTVPVEHLPTGGVVRPGTLRRLSSLDGRKPWASEGGAVMPPIYEPHPSHPPVPRSPPPAASSLAGPPSGMLASAVVPLRIAVSETVLLSPNSPSLYDTPFGTQSPLVLPLLEPPAQQQQQQGQSIALHRLHPMPPHSGPRGLPPPLLQHPLEPAGPGVGHSSGDVSSFTRGRTRGSAAADAGRSEVADIPGLQSLCATSWQQVALGPLSGYEAAAAAVAEGSVQQTGVAVAVSAVLQLQVDLQQPDSAQLLRSQLSVQDDEEESLRRANSHQHQHQEMLAGGGQGPVADTSPAVATMARLDSRHRFSHPARAVSHLTVAIQPTTPIGQVQPLQPLSPELMLQLQQQQLLPQPPSRRRSLAGLRTSAAAALISPDSASGLSAASFSSAPHSFIASVVSLGAGGSVGTGSIHKGYSRLASDSLVTHSLSESPARLAAGGGSGGLPASPGLHHRQGLAGAGGGGDSSGPKIFLPELRPSLPGREFFHSQGSHPHVLGVQHQHQTAHPPPVADDSPGRLPGLATAVASSAPSRACAELGRSTLRGRLLEHP